MIPSERHPIVSFFLDAYFIETFLNLIKKLYLPNEYFNISIRIILMIIFIFYHAYYYKKTKFRTIGELITGTYIDSDGNKYFLNPFYLNRFILWVPMFLTFVGLKSVNIIQINDLKLISSLIFIGILLLTYFSYIMLNRGYVIGLILLLIIYASLIFNVIYNKGFIIKLFDWELIIEFTLLLLFITIIIAYWIIRMNKFQNINGNVA